MAPGGHQWVRAVTMRGFAVADDWMMDFVFFFVMGVFCFFGLLGWMDSDVVWCTRGWCCFGFVVNPTRCVLLHFGLVLTVSIAWFA